MFHRAERKQAKVRIAFCAPSGAGKTYSSLLVAQGLGERIAMIETENGSGELYSDLCEYDVCRITKPFTPKKYITAIHEAERAGYDVIIIDSLTHAWAGQGGLLEEVDKRKGRGNDFSAWRDITPQHNELVNAMLESSCHVIATMRTKTAYDMVKDQKTGKVKPIKVGLAPVQRDGLEYEFTIVFDIDVDRHMATASKDRTSLFDGQCFVPDIEVGKAIKRWFLEGADVNKPISLEEVQKSFTAATSENALVAALKALSISREHPQAEEVSTLYKTRLAELKDATKAKPDDSNPPSVECPQTGQRVPLTDCASCSENENCPVMG